MWFGGVKIYTVHVKQGDYRAPQRPVFVREGFNWGAFVFSGFWTLYHRMWLHTLLIFAFNVFIIALAKYHLFSHESGAVIRLGAQVMIGFWANDWLRSTLARRGYVFTDITASDSKLRAEQRYFERYLATHAAH